MVMPFSALTFQKLFEFFAKQISDRKVTEIWFGFMPPVNQYVHEILNERYLTEYQFNVMIWGSQKVSLNAWILKLFVFDRGSTSKVQIHGDFDPQSTFDSSQKLRRLIQKTTTGKVSSDFISFLEARPGTFLWNIPTTHRILNIFFPALPTPVSVRKGYEWPGFLRDPHVWEWPNLLQACFPCRQMAATATTDALPQCSLFSESLDEVTTRMFERMIAFIWIGMRSERSRLLTISAVNLRQYPRLSWIDCYFIMHNQHNNECLLL
jgi:hypothetical protein